MAYPNQNAPRGFSPVDVRLEKCHLYYKSASVQLGIGDPVIRVADSADPSGRYPAITRATTGAAISGVVVGLQPIPGNTHNYLKAADAGYVIVCDDPNVEFIVQDNGAAILTAANLGQAIDSVAAIDCNVNTGVSKYQLDAAALASGNTWILVRCEDNPSNNVGSTYQRWIVKAALHTEVNAGATNILET